MPTTYSTQNRINLMADGENSGTWGSTTNTNWALIEQITSTALSKSVAGSSDVTLTANNGASDESRNAFHTYTGALTGNINVVVPAQSRSFQIYNNSTGSFTLTFKPSGGTGVVVPQGWSGRIWTDGSTSFFGENWAGLYHGQCQLTYVSVTSIKLVIKNGNLIRINGAWYQIPSAGVSAANTSVFVNGSSGQNLAASTLYYVYLFLNAGVLTIDFSTTTHAASTTIGNVGVEIKSGDDTRTLVGMIYANASNQFDDSATKRNVASWFNRQDRGLNTAAFSAGTTSTSFVEADATKRIEACVWSDEPPIVGVIGVAHTSTAGTQTSTNIARDNTTALIPQSVSPTTPAANYEDNITVSYCDTGFTEGRHYWTLIIVSPSGVGTAWTAMTIARVFN